MFQAACGSWLAHPTATSAASHGEMDRLARTEAVAGHGTAAFEPPATMGQPRGRVWYAHLPLDPLLQHADVVRGKQAIHRPGLRRRTSTWNPWKAQGREGAMRQRAKGEG